MVPAQHSSGTTTAAGPTASVAVAVSAHRQHNRRCDEPRNSRSSPTSGKDELRGGVANTAERMSRSLTKRGEIKEAVALVNYATTYTRNAF